MSFPKKLTSALIAAATLTATVPAPAQSPATALPQRNVTNFNGALRCMDQQLSRFGIRDVSVMLEDIPDKTSQVPAGTRDMMVSAISDMTKRSRAVKLVAFGADNQNIVGFLSNLQRQNQFGLIPQYDIRGAVSQFDADLERKETDAGFSLLGLFSLKASHKKVVNVLGFDASVIQTADLTLLNGVTSKNAMVILRDEKGGDGSATIQKVGITFSTSFTRQESQAQAVRNLIELATIELIGKLVKVPYWSCLGVALDSPQVTEEIEDWFFAFRDARDMNAFMQEQLRNRGFYEGAVDGRTNDALRAAIRAYGKGIGSRTDGRVDQAYFRDFLLKEVPPAPDEPFAVSDINPEKLGKLSIELLTTEPRPDAPLEIRVSSTSDANLYCYTQGADGKIQRFFPNRFARDPHVNADTPLTLPGRQPFRLRANAAGESHRIACLSASREIYNGLPPPLRWSDFNDIGFTNFEDIRQAFANAAKTPIAIAELVVPLSSAGGSAATGSVNPQAGGGVTAPRAGFAGLPPEPATLPAGANGIVNLNSVGGASGVITTIGPGVVASGAGSGVVTSVGPGVVAPGVVGSGVASPKPQNAGANLGTAKTPSGLIPGSTSPGPR
jgi:hypothetical protein